MRCMSVTPPAAARRCIIWDGMARAGSDQKRGRYRKFISQVEKAQAEVESRDVALIAKAASDDWRAAARGTSVRRLRGRRGPAPPRSAKVRAESSPRPRVERWRRNAGSARSADESTEETTMGGRDIALALSGGGFRAAYFNLGVLRKLDELHLLDRVGI